MHQLRKTELAPECDHRTQVRQEINNIPMWICCDCSYINKIAIYKNDTNIFDEGKGISRCFYFHQRGADPPPKSPPLSPHPTHPLYRLAHRKKIYA